MKYIRYLPKTKNKFYFFLFYTLRRITERKRILFLGRVSSNSTFSVCLLGKHILHLEKWLRITF